MIQYILYHVVDILYNMVLYQAIWYDIVSCQKSKDSTMIACNMIQYSIISYKTVLYHMVIWYFILWSFRYKIEPYDMIWYSIISHPLIFYHLIQIWYKIVSTIQYCINNTISYHTISFLWFIHISFPIKFSIVC